MKFLHTPDQNFTASLLYWCVSL